MTLRVEETYELLQSAFPDLDIHAIEFLGAGWDNQAFLVNGETVFRFPSRQEVGEALLREVRLLDRIGDQLSLQVPVFTHVSQPVAGFAYPIAGHRRVPGWSLDDPAANGIPDEIVASGLIPFLRALHGVPLDAVSDLGLTVFEPEAWRARHRRWYERTVLVARERLAATIFDRFWQTWEERFQDEGYWAFTPCLIHGDLRDEHVMIEPDPWRISGVIDFGDAWIADPALDFAGLNDHVAGLMIEAIHDPRDTTVWRRRELYRAAEPLHAIVAGIELHRSELVDSGVSCIERWFSRG